MNGLVVKKYDTFIKIYLWLSLLILIVCAQTAFATDAPPINSDSMIKNVLCQAVKLLTGDIGRVITVMIVVSLGIMLLLGKVTWGVAIALAVGIGVIFGAEGLVGTLTGGNASLC